jgi:hypothetical protein
MAARRQTGLDLAASALTRHVRTENNDLGAQAFEGFQNAQSRLVALDAMLDDICNENGVDPEAVRIMAGVKDTFTPIGEPPPDPGFDSEFRGILSKLAR